MESFFWHILSTWTHLGLFIVLLAAGFGLPLPEDIPLILAGFIVQKTSGAAVGPLVVMILVGLAGVILGDSTLFFLGRRYGAGVVEHRWFRRFAKPWLVEKARQKFAHHGAKILFIGRFMPGLRSVLFLTAGVFRVPYWKLLVFDGSAALVSVPLWVTAGWYFSAQIVEVFESARIASYVMLGVLGVGLVIWVLWEYYHNLRGGTSSSDGVDASSGLLETASAKLAGDDGKPCERIDALEPIGPNSD